MIENCRDCTILLCDAADMVTIDQCSNCRILVGACGASCFIRNCTGCEFAIASQQLRMRDCKDCALLIYCQTRPVVEASKQLRFGCWRHFYFGQLAQFREARLSPWSNHWSEVYDFSSSGAAAAFGAVSSHTDATGRGSTWEPLEAEAEFTIMDWDISPDVLSELSLYRTCTGVDRSYFGRRLQYSNSSPNTTDVRALTAEQSTSSSAPPAIAPSSGSPGANETTQPAERHLTDNPSSDVVTVPSDCKLSAQRQRGSDSGTTGDNPDCSNSEDMSVTALASSHARAHAVGINIPLLPADILPCVPPTFGLVPRRMQLHGTIPQPGMQMLVLLTSQDESREDQAMQLVLSLTGLSEDANGAATVLRRTVRASIDRSRLTNTLSICRQLLTKKQSKALRRSVDGNKGKATRFSPPPSWLMLDFAGDDLSPVVERLKHAQLGAPDCIVLRDAPTIRAVLETLIE